MAWFPTVGGLENIIETVLWTNPSPSDSSGFAFSDVTLSDNLSNYDYVEFIYGYAYNQLTPSTTSSNRFSVVYNVKEFMNTVEPTTFGFSGVINVTHRSNGNFYDRRMLYKNDTTITFGSCMAYKNEATVSIANIFAIPLQIIGIKYGIELPKPAWELGAPDVTEAFTVNPTETHSITVTRKPRYIQLYRTVSNSTYDYGYSLIYDVENDNCRYIGYNGSFATGTTASAFLGDVTSSAVQVKGASSGSTVYIFAVAIWY